MTDDIESRGRWFWIAVPAGIKEEREPRGMWSSCTRQVTAVGDMGQVEDPHGFFFFSLERTFDRAQVEKNNHNQESNSASPMTVAFKAPPQCEGGRGGWGRPPLRAGDCTLQTSFSTARCGIFTRSQKSKLAMGNWILGGVGWGWGVGKGLDF